MGPALYELAVVTTRHVEGWYYAVTGAVAVLTVVLVARRGWHQLGAVALAVGAALNLCWELLLTTAWGRSYRAPIDPVVQLLYQALTEFAPLFVLLLVVLSETGWLSAASRPAPSSVLTLRQSQAVLVGYLLLVSSLGAGLLFSVGITGHVVRVQRHVTWTFFVVEVLLAVGVLGLNGVRGTVSTFAVFAGVGATNVLLECIGLVIGARTYTGVPEWVLAVTIGFAEGGTAAAIVWTVLVSRGLVTTATGLSWRWPRWRSSAEEGPNATPRGGDSTPAHPSDGVVSADSSASRSPLCNDAHEQCRRPDTHRRDPDR